MALRLVSRRRWNAAPPRCRDPLPADDARGIAVHYTAMNADEQDDHGNCAGRVRAIQRFHMSADASDPSKPWCDIAYNHLFCRHGYVFEGRGFGARSAAQGSNEGNAHYFAVCFLGNDQPRRDDVTAAGRRALGELVLEYRRRYPGAREVRPHSAFHSTACPGDELRAWIAREGWREQERAWPLPIPRWFWAWARWRLAGRPGRRPRSAPKRIPRWAWRRLQALVRGRKR